MNIFETYKFFISKIDFTKQLQYGCIDRNPQSRKGAWIKSSLDTLQSIIDSLQINDDVEPVREYLSQYGTFCDRKYYYIDPKSNFNILPIEDKMRIFLTDVYYAMQDFTLISNNPKLIEKMQYKTMLFLRWFEFYKDFKLTYTQSQHSKGMGLFFKENSHHDLTNVVLPHLFKTNSREWILNTIMNDEQLLKKNSIKRFSCGSGDVITLRPDVLHVTYSMMYMTHNIFDTVKICMNNDNKLVKTNSKLYRQILKEEKIIKNLLN